MSLKRPSLVSESIKTFVSVTSCRFGNPFILYLERTVTWDVLQKEILEKMRHLLRPGVLVQVCDKSADTKTHINV